MIALAVVAVLADATTTSTPSIGGLPIDWTTILQGGVLGVIVVLFVTGFIVAGKTHSDQVQMLTDQVKAKDAKIDELTQLMLKDTLPAVSQSSEAIRSFTQAATSLLTTTGALQLELEDLRSRRRRGT